MNLNLGGGGHNPDGFVEVDRQSGQEIYPLPFGDGVADVIRASHCLEHFSHKVVGDVVKEWVRVLKPGGVLRIAVPDFRKIALWYAQGRNDLPLQLYLMGGQTDENDYHKTIFEHGLLKQVMEDAGLENIRHWTSELEDNASWEVSLNLEGTKKAEDNWIESIPLYNRYSQFGEDAILEAIFNRIGTSPRPFCVDVGAADGILFSNVRQWLEKGWEGVLIEADAERHAALEKNTAQFPGVRCLLKKVGSSGLDSLLFACDVPEDFDLLNIDIDGQDYYLWNSLLSFRPRVVVIEYDPEADPMFIPPFGGKGQAGSKAMMYVAAARGYFVVKQTQTNLICIRRDICEEVFNAKSYAVVTTPAPAAPEPEPEPDAPIALPAQPDRPIKITAVVSVPRLGINANWHCTIQALLALGIKIQMVEGAFWSQCLTRGIQAALDDGADVIVTIDYDSVFTVQHLSRLLELLFDQTEFDCVVPVQAKREANEVLFQSDGRTDLSQPLTNILTGHFGLTAFDARVFAKLEKPWFFATPNADGDWGDGRVDDDINFWKRWRDAGLKLALASEVRIGHLEFMVTWCTNDMRLVRQSVTDYRKNGQPANCNGVIA
jgi:predicted SAM-dependent methyltransferase